MRIPVLLSTALVLTGGSLGIACSGSEPTESTMESDISQLRAHTPLHEHSSASQAQIPDPASSYTGVDGARLAQRTAHFTWKWMQPERSLASPISSSIRWRCSAMHGSISMRGRESSP